MKVHLSRITSEGLAVAFSVEVARLARLTEETDTGAAPGRGTVEADLVLKNVEETVLITGRVRADLELPCNLCLLPVRVILDEEIRVVQSPVDVMRGLASDLELTTYELDIDFFEGEEIDLTELVEEQVLLMRPPSVHCRDDCAGLCANCGANLNEAPCTCKDGNRDHPFAAMKNFFPDPSG